MPTHASENIISAADAVIDPTQYEETETLFVKYPADRPSKAFDLKLEHFDDVLLDNSDQSTWAGLDSFLIDEEFLYLADEEADRIYHQLKQRQLRRKNLEETERRLNSRMRDLEALASAEPARSQSEGWMQTSAEYIKDQIAKFSTNDKLDFTQGLLGFANQIDKRYLVDGLIMSLHILAKETPEIKLALLDQFLPLMQLVQEKRPAQEQVRAAQEVLRLIDDLLYDPKEAVKEKAIKMLLDIRSVVQPDDKESVMKLTLKLAHDADENNRISALKILNEFA